MRPGGASAARRERWPLGRKEPRGRKGALPAPRPRGNVRSPRADTGVRGGVVVGRGNGGGAAAPASLAAPVVVLVGELYLDVASGIEVRVIDSRLAAGAVREFVVEAVDGSRPGDRWLRGATELKAIASISPTHPRLVTRRDPDGLVQARRGAQSLAERLVERGQTMLDALEGRDRRVAFGAVADELGRLVPALRHAVAVLDAMTRATRPGGNAR
jgi:hypothetical protein